MPEVVIAALAGAAGGGAVVWLLMFLRRQAERIAQSDSRIAELERLQRDGPAWSATMKLEHRAQLLSVATLVKLAARDNLDALARVSPGLADEVIREIAPHLFEKGNVK